MDVSTKIEKKGTIYLIKSPDGKPYIGYTKQKVNYRWSKHHNLAMKGSDKLQCRVLGAAIRKYGCENMTKEVIQECDLHEMKELEIKYIAQYNSLAPNGYNLTKGGDAVALQMAKDYLELMRPTK